MSACSSRFDRIRSHATLACVLFADVDTAEETAQQEEEFQGRVAKKAQENAEKAKAAEAKAAEAKAAEAKEAEAKEAEAAHKSSAASLGLSAGQFNKSESTFYAALPRSLLTFCLLFVFTCRIGGSGRADVAS